MDEANDGMPGADGKYVTGDPWTCFACEALVKSQAAFRKALPDDNNEDRQFKWGVELIHRHNHTTQTT